MHIEAPRRRLVRNVGLKPFNPLYGEVFQAIQEIGTTKEIGVMVLKPGYFSTDQERF